MSFLHFHTFKTFSMSRSLSALCESYEKKETTTKHNNKANFFLNRKSIIAVNSGKSQENFVMIRTSIGLNSAGKTCSISEVVSDFSHQRPRSPVHVPTALSADIKFDCGLYRVNGKATFGQVRL